VTDSYPIKRKRRPRRDRFPKPGDIDVLVALLHCSTLHTWAAEFDSEAGTAGGAPPHHPAVTKLVYGVMAKEWGGLRPTERNLAQKTVWNIVSKVLRPMYPDWACFRTGGKAPTRHQYMRFRDRYCTDDRVFEALATIAMVDACQQAIRMGQLTADRGGSTTHMSPDRIISGDGTVLAARYKSAPGQLQLNPVTGELEQRRFDPDAEYYKTGTGDRVFGTKFVLLESRSNHEDEVVLLGVRHQPAGHPGGEGAIALDMIRAVHPHLPDLQGVTWDKALRGTHIDELYDLGLQSVIKVSKDKGGTKSRRIGAHSVNGLAQPETVQVYAHGGAVGIQVLVRGQATWVKCIKIQVKNPRNRSGKYRWYAIYEIPDHAPVPPNLRKGRFMVRLNGRASGDPTDLNRAEVIRPVAEDDPEWAELYARRQGPESTNAWFKYRLPGGRAPAVGAKRQRFEMLCVQLHANIRALIAFRRRHGLPDFETHPPGALSA
jgi:hypothetical protein